MTPSGGGYRILIVDDNPDIHQDYRKILTPEAVAGGLRDLESQVFGIRDDRAEPERYEVDSAYQGAEALEMVKASLRESRPYALAFVDMRMPPGWDGLETIERLWEIESEIQVVICTAYSDHSREDIIARLGFAHRLVILKKPFDTSEVAQLTYAMTAKWRATRQAQLKMSELEDLVKQRTSELTLTNSELQDRLVELVQTQSALERSEQRFSLAAAGSNDGLWDWDLTTDRVHYSARWNTILGLPEVPVDGAPGAWFSRLHPNDALAVRRAIDDHLTGVTPHLEFEHRLRTRDDTYRWVLCRGVAVRDEAGKAIRVAGSLSDISQRKENEHELRRGAYYDRLTGLPNRSLFRECLEEAIAERRSGSGTGFAVLFLDFDNFKVINDSMGHLAGDELLVIVGARMSKYLKSVSPEHSAHTLARLGGDEFVVLLKEIEHERDALAVADAIQAVLAEPMTVRGTELHASASIGVTIDDESYTTPDDILRDADTAMYNAKAAGAGLSVLFDAAMREGAVARLALENELRWAIQCGDLDVAYQPIIDLETGMPIGVEALARWTHPEQGPVSPDRFIPIAEETGLIVPLGEHVLRRACEDIKKLRSFGPDTRDLHVNINLSSSQFSQPTLVAFVLDVLREHGLPPQALCLEVTETVVMDDVGASAATIRGFRDLGVEVYIDDFGTGYSSLSCLKLLPLTGLKLDRSFIMNFEDASANPAIIHAVVALAGHLRLKVVAEGVETKDQLAGVLALECNHGQGYYFGRPMDIGSMLAWLSARREERHAA